MQYDELVGRLRDDNACLSLKTLHEAADAIEELEHHVFLADLACKAESAKAPRWIPVSERLPEEQVFVLILQDDGRMMVAEKVDGDWWYRYFAYDVDRWDENEQGKITHWMPLPKGPEEET